MVTGQLSVTQLVIHPQICIHDSWDPKSAGSVQHPGIGRFSSGRLANKEAMSDDVSTRAS